MCIRDSHYAGEVLRRRGVFAIKRGLHTVETGHKRTFACRRILLVAAPVNPKAIIVMGVHRSGTSALAGALSMLGFHPGSSLLPAVQGVNNNGFFEDQRVVDLNDRILGVLGRDWRWPTPLPQDWLKHPELKACLLYTSPSPRDRG